MSDYYEKITKKRNIRDFRNLPCEGGRSVVEGRFFRSAGLDKLCSRDLKYLEERGVKIVIDLRTPEEISQKPDKIIRGAMYYSIPVFDGAMLGITHERNYKITDVKLPDMAKLYKDMVTHSECLGSLSEVFRIICNAKEGEGILWHCSQGKDRCGLVSALFLGLLGASQDAIMGDYDVTNRYNLKKAWLLSKLAYIIKRDGEFAGSVHQALIADRRYLDAALNAIAEGWGDMDTFFRKGLKITDEMRENLRRRALKA